MNLFSIATYKVWWKASRYHFTIFSSLPILFGSAIALSTKHSFSIPHLLLMLLAVILNHIALNLSDDYFDFLHGADVLGDGEGNAYSGGSRVLVTGELSPLNFKIAFIILYSLVACIGLYFVYISGPLILLLGFIGLFSSYYYTAPPIKFSYRGLGEVCMFINFGPILIMGAYYVQAHAFESGAFLMSLPLGLLTLAVILCNEIPDDKSDAAAGKRTLVVRFGRKNGLILAILTVIISYAIIFYAILLGYAPLYTCLSLLTIPLAYSSFHSLYNTLQDGAPDANSGIMQVHLYISLILIASYLIQAALEGHSLHGIIAILFATIILMFPAYCKQQSVST